MLNIDNRFGKIIKNLILYVSQIENGQNGTKQQTHGSTICQCVFITMIIRKGIYVMQDRSLHIIIGLILADEGKECLYNFV